MREILIVAICALLASVAARAQSGGNLTFRNALDMAYAAMTISAGSLITSRYLVILKTPDCKPIVLVDNEREMRIGCATELTQ